MHLFELFEADDASAPGDDAHALQPASGGQMTQQIRQAALDVITPLLGQNVPFITMKQLIDSLSGARFGIVITPALIMTVLDPDEVKAVSKIDGDRIYLAEPTVPQHEVDQDHAQRDKQHVGKMAVGQINQQRQQH